MGNIPSVRSREQIAQEIEKRRGEQEAQKRKKNAGKLILLAIAFVFVGFLVLREREKNSRINPEIFTTFRGIENYCREYVDRELVSQSELEKCKAVVAKEEACSGKNSFCDAREYYDYFLKLGFELPPFYLDSTEQ